MSNKVVARSVKEMGAVLAEMAPKLQQLLPRHISADRVIKVALMTMQRDPKLLLCSPASVFQALAEATQLGLHIGPYLGQAYLVPFADKTGQHHAQLIIGYKGLVDLVLRGGDVADIVARAVYQGDEFRYTYGLNESLVHVPADGDKDPSSLTHVYAIARYRDTNLPPKFVVLTRAQVEKVRRASRSGNSDAWVTWYEEMAMKTAIRKLCKGLRLSPDVAEALARDEATELGYDVPAITTGDDIEQKSVEAGKAKARVRQRLVAVAEQEPQQEEEAPEQEPEPQPTEQTDEGGDEDIRLF